MIITIETEYEDRLEKIQNEFVESGYVIDFIHHAFYFADDVEKLISGEITISIDEALGKEPPKFKKNSNLNKDTELKKNTKPKKTSNINRDNNELN